MAANQTTKKTSSKKDQNVVLKGILSVLDFFASILISFTVRVAFGIKAVIMFLWKHFFKYIYDEIYAILGAAISALVYFGIISFLDVPKYLFGKGKKYGTEAFTFVKKQSEITKEKTDSGKTLTQIVTDYLTKKYESLPIVQEQKAKREASLSVITIDPNNEEDTRRSEIKHTYKYTVKNKAGKFIEGYFPAFSKLDVYSYLIDEGYTVYEIITNKQIDFLHGQSTDGQVQKRMKTKDLVFWLAQLSTYIKAGIPLTDAVKILAQQNKRAKYKGLYDAIIFELTTGETFSEALRKQGSSFPPLLINMIKSAEMIGNIEGTLDEMSVYYQEVEDLKKSIISALAYPCCLLVFAIGILVFMLVYIIPKFVDVYDSMNAEINAITQFTLDLSDFIQNEYAKILLIVVLSAATFYLLYTKVKAFRKLMQTFFMKLPVVGKLITYKEISMFARTFATLQKNNVLLTDSIEILGKISSNEIYKTIMRRTIDNLLKGEKMSETFKDHWAIPDVAYYMILTGESTGELAEMLEKTGVYYQKLEKNMVGMMKTFIEPVLIIFLALMVGFIMVAIVVPMFGLYSTIA